MPAKPALDPNPCPARPGRRSARALRWFRGMVVGALLGVLAFELASWAYLGFGRRVAMVGHPTIEYVCRPNQLLRRYGNRIEINAWGMRSVAFPKAKTDPRELRVLVIGDSVVFGGNQTDQSELATTLAAQRLEQVLGRSVTVANVSAGSWGPQNQIAFVESYGWFDADLAVVVLSSHDLADVPTFRPVRPGGLRGWFFPASRELFFDFALPRLGWTGGGGQAERGSPALRPDGGAVVEPGSPEGALRRLTEQAAADKVGLALLYFPTRQELAVAPPSGASADLIALAATLGVDEQSFLGLKTRLMAESAGGAGCYRDSLHPNVKGQRLMADQLVELILQRYVGPDSALSRPSSGASGPDASTGPHP